MCKRDIVFTLFLALSCTIFFASHAIGEEKPEYIQVTTYTNFGQTKQFARYTEGITATEVKDESGSKINFMFSHAKLCNYFHKMGYEYVGPSPGPRAETEDIHLFKLE